MALAPFAIIAGAYVARILLSDHSAHSSVPADYTVSYVPASANTDMNSFCARTHLTSAGSPTDAGASVPLHPTESQDLERRVVEFDRSRGGDISGRNFFAWFFDFLNNVSLRADLPAGAQINPACTALYDVGPDHATIKAYPNQ